MTSKMPTGENKMKKKFVLFFFVFALSSISVFSQSNVVTIIPFVGQGISQGDADTFTEMFISEYARVTKSDIADRSNFDGIVAQHKFQLSEWSNDDKVAKLGKAMNAGKIICGRLSVFGYSITFTARILDVNSTKVLNSINWKGGSFDELLTGMTNIAKDLGGMYYIGGKGSGGGIVFYESEVGFPVPNMDGTSVICHYLEVSSIELGDILWCPCSGPGEYLCYIETIDTVGYGKLNTQKIIASHKNATARNCAAKACFDYFTEKTNTNDWFLPNKQELNLVYENLVKTKIIVSNKSFWTSSQGLDTMYGMRQYFSNGLQNAGTWRYKEFALSSGTHSVLAVRAF